MAMTVSYSVVPRKNPAKKSEPAKYYAQAQASGELDFQELCDTEKQIGYYFLIQLRKSLF